MPLNPVRLLARAPLVALVCSVATPTRAADFGPVEKAHEAYNRTAERAGLDSRMTLKDCSAEAARICTHSLSGNLAAIAGTSTTNHATANDMTIMLAKDSDPLSFAEAVIVSIATWSPSATKEQRGAVFKKLTGALKTQKKVEAVLGPSTYKMMPLGPAGLWFVVE